MAYYFAGNTLASLGRTSSAVTETTLAGTFDPAMVANSIQVTDGTRCIARLPTPATGRVWLHFEHQGAINPNSATGWVQFVNADGNVFFRVSALSVSLSAQIWNGSTWVAVGQSFTPSRDLNRFDIMFDYGTGGSDSSFAIYVQGTLVSSASGLTVVSSVRNLGSVQFGTWVSQPSRFSQIIIGDTDTRDSRYSVLPITGNGALTDGTGGASDINETVLDDLTSIKLPASGNRKTFTKQAVTVPTGYRIATVTTHSRGRVSGAVTDGRTILRSGGANYPSGNMALNGGFEPRSVLWDINPANGNGWNKADLDATEVGVEAV